MTGDFVSRAFFCAATNVRTGPFGLTWISAADLFNSRNVPRPAKLDWLERMLILAGFAGANPARAMTASNDRYANNDLKCMFPFVYFCKASTASANALPISAKIFALPK